MKNVITRGQLAKMMGVSINQIRYFERKEVLYPKFVDSNGYHMYGVEELTRLFNIMFLRQIDIPVGKIKDLFDNGDVRTYSAVMEKSLVELDAQIKAMESMKVQMLELLDILKVEESEFTIKKLDVINLSKLIEYPIPNMEGIIEYYDISKTEGIDASKWCLRKIYEIVDNDLYYICEKVDDNGDYIIDEGDYLCYRTFVKDYDEIKSKIAYFNTYASEQKLKLTGYCLVIWDPYLSVLDNSAYPLTIQKRIK